MSDSNVADLCPELLIIYREWLIQCHGLGLAVKAIVTWRTASEQDKAKADGLSQAAAGESPHNCCSPDGLPFSKAFDFAVFDDDATYIKNGSDDRYAQAGEIGEGLGLEWGGRWKHPDWDHLELKNWRSV